MSENFIRTGLDEDADASSTDWAAIKAKTDGEIDSAIARDPDSYAVSRADTLGHEGASYHYIFYVAEGGQWRWNLIGSDGKVLAASAESFGSRDVAEDAVRLLRDAMLGARANAA